MNKLLKMDPGSADLLAQKQKYLTDAIDATKKKLAEIVRTAVTSVSGGTNRNCNTSQSNGTAYEMAMLAMEACRLTLGTTEAEFKNFANGTETLSLYAKRDIETWRIFMSWLTQTVGCNVMAGRDGSIIFCPYGKEIVDTLDEAKDAMRRNILTALQQDWLCAV